MKKLKFLVFAFVAFLFAGVMSVSAYDVTDEASLRLTGAVKTVVLCG